ncbi:unnamed protein product [Oppiella nova]|uniref:C2H2-type domain-containing protein n=1 Tax=Oppiella nova TaxID=334625 RepID=A0A7R9LU18_9ACAR|nr:unnamed protein product [Oppiella nova]CAG2166343.1 unnamed protein product [Oppiella nova]
MDVTDVCESVLEVKDFMECLRDENSRLRRQLLKDFMECLRDENSRLRRQLCFAQKCMDLFLRYRHCLTGFANNCLCDQNFDNQLVFNQLEDEYRHVEDEDVQLSAHDVDDCLASSVTFNRNETPVDTNYKIMESIGGDHDIDDHQTNDEDINYNNVLLNKFSKRMKTLNEDEDYRLMYMKTTEDSDCQQFRCKWFKCGLSFDSQTSLSHHTKADHFKINDNYDNLPQILQSDDELVIETDDDITRRHSKPRVKSKPVVEPEFVCDWIGCDLEFRSNFDLKRHQNMVHRRREQTLSSLGSGNRFIGFKPLTIHTLDDSSPQQLQPILREVFAEKIFKCDLCDKSYTRKDSLRHHQRIEHNSGGRALRMHYCDQCEYSTSNGGHMKRHIIRKHTNERPFKCDLDGCHPDVKCYATLEQLKSHQMKIHPNIDFSMV